MTKRQSTPPAYPSRVLRTAPDTAGAHTLATPDGRPRDPVAQQALDAALAAAKTYAEEALAASTRRAYASDWRIFEAWCATTQVISLPATADTVELFIGSQAYHEQKSPSTLTRRLAAIGLVHQGLGYPSPCGDRSVTLVMQGIRRTHGKALDKKAPTLPLDIRRMVDACPPKGLRGLRDRALLLFGFATAMRRSELVAVDRQHLKFVYDDDDERRVDTGVTVTIPGSKTDQNRKGTTIAVPAEPGSDYCPVRALQDWLAMKKVGAPAVFLRIRKGDRLATVGTSPNANPTRLTPQSVAALVKKYAAMVELDPKQFAGHSFRRGWLTAAAQQDGADIFKMAEHSRHKSMDVLRGYIDEAKKFDNHAGQGLLKGDSDASS